MRIASPPITHPDFYGIDTPDQQKLLAANHEPGGHAHSIIGRGLPWTFLSIDGHLYKAVGLRRPRSRSNPQFTDHCFTGDYPTRLTRPRGAGVHRSSSRSWPKSASRPLLS